MKQKDKSLINSFITYLNCGYIVYNNNGICTFIITKLEDIINIIIPFFEKNPVLGNKALDYADFKKVAGLMKHKAHLNETGLVEIISIKSGMNRGRANKNSC